MNRFSVILMLCFFLVLSAMDYPEPFVEPLNHYEETGSSKGDSLNVRFVGNWPFGPSYAVAYDSVRSLAFCGSGGGVYILDVSDPSSPVKVSERIHTRSLVRGLFYDYSSERLYIANDYAGLEIWDVSTPASPVKLGSYDTPGYAYDVAVSGSYAYVADASSGLRVIDISDPLNPVEVGSYDTPGSACGVEVTDSYAYVADYYSLRVIDISDPSNPTEVGFYDIPDYASGVAVSGNYAYVVDWDSGLCVIDVSNPSNPVKVGSYDTPYWASDVSVSGTYAYIAGSFAGLLVIDISDPSNPVEVGYYDTPYRPQDIAVGDSFVYVADFGAGLQIYENLLLGIDDSRDQIALPIRLLQNPVAGDYIEIELSLKQQDMYEIGLYNLLGQEVKTFSISGLSAGRHRIRLETKGLAGGVYFLRAADKKTQQYIKVTIMK